VNSCDIAPEPLVVTSGHLVLGREVLVDEALERLLALARLSKDMCTSSIASTT
jgi:hypothetical protein